MTEILKKITAAAESLKALETEVDAIPEVRDQESDALLGKLRELRNAYDTVKGKLVRKQEDFFHALASCAMAITEFRLCISNCTFENYLGQYRIRHNAGKLENASDQPIAVYRLFCSEMIKLIESYPDKVSRNDFKKREEAIRDLVEKLRLVMEKMKSDPAPA